MLKARAVIIAALLLLCLRHETVAATVAHSCETVVELDMRNGSCVGRLYVAPGAVIAAGRDWTRYNLTRLFDGELQLGIYNGSGAGEIRIHAKATLHSLHVYADNVTYTWSEALNAPLSENRSTHPGWRVHNISYAAVNDITLRWYGALTELRIFVLEHTPPAAAVEYHFHNYNYTVQLEHNETNVTHVHYHIYNYTNYTNYSVVFQNYTNETVPVPSDVVQRNATVVVNYHYHFYNFTNYTNIANRTKLTNATAAPPDSLNYILIAVGVPFVAIVVACLVTLLHGRRPLRVHEPRRRRAEAVEAEVEYVPPLKAKVRKPMPVRRRAAIDVEHRPATKALPPAKGAE